MIYFLMKKTVSFCFCSYQKFLVPPNPVTNDTLFIYQAYLTKMTTKEKPDGQWYVRMTLFGNCHDDNKKKHVFEPFVLTNTDGKNYSAVIYPVDATCYSGFTGGCLYGAYFIEAAIPESEVENIGETVSGFHLLETYW